MKYLDEKLINARPESESSNERFVRQTMTAVERAHGRETFTALTRTNSVNKKEKFMTKLLTMPRLATAALGIGAALVAGGATYAADNWFGANVSTNQKAAVVSSVATKCAPSQVQAHKSAQSQTNTAKYKILKPELISERDLQLYDIMSCEQRAIESKLRAAQPDVFRPGDSYHGLYYPVGRYGTVVRASSNEIQVRGIPDDHRNFVEDITATLKLNPQTVVTDKGKTAEITSFKPGDHIYFIFQNPVRKGQNDTNWRDTPGSQSTLRAIAKTQYDFSAITQKVNRASAQGAFTVIEKSDAYGG